MKRFGLLITLAAAGLIAGCEDRSAAPNNNAPPPNTSSAPVKPDNTARNERDQDSNTKTPLDQSNDSRDIEITAAVRRSIVDDDTMSTNAENIKIITNKGAVTLRGVVNSQAEKEAIEAKAKGVAGVVSVDNQLEVKTE